jgi:integrase
MGGRGSREGSIRRRRDRRWEGRYAVHTAEGRKQKTVYGKIRKEVPEKLTSESR